MDIKEMLICHICGYTHELMISSSHLKSHNITGKEYKEMFPGAVLRIQKEETKAKISKSKNGTPSWNAGLKLGKSDKPSKLKGRPNFARRGKTFSEETKRKISENTKKAMVNVINDEFRKKLSDSIKRRKENNTYVPPMLNKTHSNESKKKIKESLAKTTKKKRQIKFEKLSKILSNDNIELLKIDYINCRGKAYLKCNNCSHEFNLTTQYFNKSYIKFSSGRLSNICEKCYPRNSNKSRKEIELLKYIKTILKDREVQSGNKSEIPPYELDIFIPSLNIAVEFCGIFWHSAKQSTNRSKYHLYEKYLMCKDKGIKLLTIFEDDWDLYKNEIKQLLKMKILEDTNDYSNLEFKIVNSKCYLVSKILPKYGIVNIFQNAFNQFNVDEIVYYSDNAWNNDEELTNLGFKLEKIILPKIWYVQTNAGKMQYVRQKPEIFNSTDEKILKNSDTIYDCGYSKWTLKKD